MSRRSRAPRGTGVHRATTGQETGEIDPDVDAESMARVIFSLQEGLVLQKAWDPSTDVTGYVEAARALLRGRLFSQRTESC